MEDNQERYFQFQLDLLMKEIDLVDHAISRLDEILLRNRNWGTTLWAGLIAILLQDTGLRTLTWATSFIPLLFWLIDIRWKIALLQCSDRQSRISGFLNSAELQTSFETKQISPIKLLHPTGDDMRPSQRVNFSKVIRYKDTLIFYPMQILGSLLLFIFLA